MRVFAGLPIPEDVIAGLKGTIDAIRGRYRGMSFTKPAGMHITLHFFGEITEKAVSPLLKLMEDPLLRAAKIRSKTGGVGSFPPKGNPRVLYVGLVLGIDEIAEYYRLYNEQIAKLGYEEEEHGEFIPHVTIARNKGERIDPEFLKSIEYMPMEFYFDRLVLYSSRLERTGAVYTALATVMFR